MKNENIKKIISIISLGLIIYIFMFMKIPYYIDTPGNIENVSKYISISNNYKPNSTINTTYVTEYTNPNLAMFLMSFLNKDWDAVKISNELYSGQSETDANYEGKAELEESRDYAIMSAYKLANKTYAINNFNLYVTYISKDAKTDLRVKDDIKTVNGIKLTSLNSLKEIIKNCNVGDKVNITVNDNQSRYAYVNSNSDGKYIGILANEDYDLDEDPKIVYNSIDNSYGPSAGFMMSLYIYSSITNFSLPSNTIIAGTGTIDSSGNVGIIGGVKYKLIGAAQNGANIFFVPSDNYDEALSIKNEYHYNIQLVKVNTLSDAIKYLESKR